MRIRQLAESDLDAVAELYLKAYKADWSVVGARTYIEKFWRFEPESCLVTEESDKSVTGAVLGYSYTREFGLVLFIQELFVDPQYRKDGYGKFLISRLRDSFSEKARVKITPLVKADTSVLNFYNSLGFESDTTVSFFDDF